MPAFNARRHARSFDENGMVFAGLEDGRTNVSYPRSVNNVSNPPAVFPLKQTQRNPAAILVTRWNRLRVAFLIALSRLPARSHRPITSHNPMWCASKTSILDSYGIAASGASITRPTNLQNWFCGCP